eukprot:929005_1
MGIHEYAVNDVIPVEFMADQSAQTLLLQKSGDELRKIFEQFDLDFDGEIVLADFQSGLQRMGISLQKSEVAKMFHSVEANSFLNLESFSQLIFLWYLEGDCAVGICEDRNHSHNKKHGNAVGSRPVKHSRNAYEIGTWPRVSSTDPGPIEAYNLILSLAELKRITTDLENTAAALVESGMSNTAGGLSTAVSLSTAEELSSSESDTETRRISVELAHTSLSISESDSSSLVNDLSLTPDLGPATYLSTGTDFSLAVDFSPPTCLNTATDLNTVVELSTAAGSSTETGYGEHGKIAGEHVSQSSQSSLEPGSLSFQKKFKELEVSSQSDPTSQPGLATRRHSPQIITPPLATRSADFPRPVPMYSGRQTRSAGELSVVQRELEEARGQVEEARKKLRVRERDLARMMQTATDSVPTNADIQVVKIRADDCIVLRLPQKLWRATVFLVRAHEPVVTHLGAPQRKLSSIRKHSAVTITARKSTKTPNVKLGYEELTPGIYKICKHCHGLGPSGGTHTHLRTSGGSPRR